MEKTNNGVTLTTHEVQEFSYQNQSDEWYKDKKEAFEAWVTFLEEIESDDYGYCPTGEYFIQHLIVPKWDNYDKRVEYIIDFLMEHHLSTWGSDKDLIKKDLLDIFEECEKEDSKYKLNKD